MAERWHVLGPGAIGSLFAAFLQNAGAEVVLLDHRGNTEKSRSIVIDGLPPAGRFEFDVSPVAASEAIDYLLITTKAYSVLDALTSIGHRLRSASTAVLMVNGMGLDADIRSRFPDLGLVLGTTTEGAFRRADDSLCHAGSGTTRIGSPTAAAPEPPWFDSFSQAVPDCHWEPDMVASLWRKLAINAAINPLTALLRCTNGELAGDPADQVRTLCAEITAVAQAAGMERAVESLERAVFDVIDNTAGNRSSMLQDVEAGRPTEIDYITGWLVEQAQELGIDTPANAALLEKMKTHGH